MSLLRYLQKTIASFLRPWILQKDLIEPLLLHIHLSRIVLELQSLELDCAFINSSLLSTSPFLLRQARLDHAKLTISLIRSPGVSLNVRGLHFVCHIRPPDDSFWDDREKQLVDVWKREAIAALDPLGASVHLAAERHARERATSSMLKAFMANLVLQALQVDLHDGSLELQSKATDRCKCSYILTLQSLVLKEGYGLAGAFVRRLTIISKEADYSLSKICFLQNLGLHLSTSRGKSGQSKSADSRAGLEDEESNHHFVNSYLLLWKTVTLIADFQDGDLNAIDSLFAETVIQFSLAEAEAILATINQLQGAPRASHTAVDSEKRQRSRKGARYLWQRAFEKITGASWRKFKDAVQAGLLRQRYSQIYASWILKAGEGIFDDIGLLNRRKDSQGKKPDLLSLERELSYLEQELPTEAIVLARFLGRSKVFTDSDKLVMTTQPIGSAVWNRAVLFVFVFWGALKKCYKTMAGLLKRLLSIISPYVQQFLSISGFEWIFQRCMRGILSLRRNFCSLTNAPRRLETGDHLPEAFSEILDKSRLRILNKLKRGTCFNSTFHMGSVTFIGSMEHFSTNHVRRLFKASGINLLEGEKLPGVRFSFANLSVVYSSHATALGFELVLGHLQGEVGTVSLRHLDTDTATEGQRHSLFIEKEGAKFLRSGPAPQIRVPARVNDQFDSYEKGLSSFLNFLGKDPVSVSRPFEKAHESNVRPFIILSYENTQKSSTPPDRKVQALHLISSVLLSTSVKAVKLLRITVL